jgi:hypothetical protein
MSTCADVMQRSTVQLQEMPDKATAKKTRKKNITKQ